MAPKIVKRNKVIFFRVSEPEFYEIQRACTILGLRSVSECARVAVKRLVSNSESETNQLLQALAHKLDEVSEILQAHLLTTRSFDVEVSQNEMAG